MSLQELDTKASPRIVNTELPDGSSVIIFPVALAPGSDMLLTRKEVAQILRLSEGFLRHLGAKIMPTVKLGGAVRYRLSDVLTYIDSKTVTAGISA
jgi:predicted DNA-binding transcriptional regulator AlpA